MTTAVELASELAQLQKDFREFAQSDDFQFSELTTPTPGGFVEQYRERTAEIVKGLARQIR